MKYYSGSYWAGFFLCSKPGSPVVIKAITNNRNDGFLFRIDRLIVSEPKMPAILNVHQSRHHRGNQAWPSGGMMQ